MPMKSNAGQELTSISIPTLDETTTEKSISKVVTVSSPGKVTTQGVAEKPDPQTESGPLRTASTSAAQFSTSRLSQQSNFNSKEASADTGEGNESAAFLVVGIVIAGVVVIGICAGAVAFCCCAGRSEQTHKAATNYKTSVIVEAPHAAPSKPGAIVHPKTQNALTAGNTNDHTSITIGLQ